MMENDAKGIDEIEVVKRLWRKRYFIITITILSVIIGVSVIRFRPQVYTVVLNITFKNIEGDYLKQLVQYGNMDFGHYKQTGVIGEDTLLRFSDAERMLLKHLSKDVDIQTNYNDCKIIISGNARDSLSLLNDLDDFEKVLRKSMLLLHESLCTKLVDSLNVNIDNYRYISQKQLRELICFQDEFQDASNLEKRIQLKLLEAEFLTSFPLKKISELQERIACLESMEIICSSPVVKFDPIRLDVRSLMKWMFLGLVGSCIWVLGSSQVQMLLKKRRK